MEGLLRRLRQWTIEVIGQEEYDRLSIVPPKDDNIAYPCKSMVTCDNEYIFKAVLVDLFFQVTEGRIFFRISMKEYPHILIALLYDPKLILSIDKYIEQYLQRKNITKDFSLDRNLDGYRVKTHIEHQNQIIFIYLGGYKQAKRYDLKFMLHPKRIKETIDKELDKKLYSLSVYIERRKRCRKSVIYFMTAFKRVFSRDICTMIGKMVYETSKNDYCW